MEAFQIIWVSAFLVLLVFVPGLAVTLALFPKKRGLTWSERLGLSLIFGLAPQLLLYFLTKNLGMPINTLTSSLAIAFVTLAGIAVWKKRR
ncbi:MAG: DUF1616 domain-containing protein [Candidatus Altiarchaeales archaeon]|nr:DUF1616 domain-containing protein [Candidatus Altiarchaeales archaeon]MBD3416670.1 DUF1616 domain-containing protein [Candidatus Altiarchaeales archaeon]